MEAIIDVIRIVKKFAPSAAQIARFLKKVGWGNMARGIAVIFATGAAGGATAGVIATMIAQNKIRDRELRELAEELKRANELYEAAKRVTEQQKAEINDLNKRIIEMLKSQRKNREQLESLKARVAALIKEFEQAKEV
jgi:uncharacterized membrane protein